MLLEFNKITEPTNEVEKNLTDFASLMPKLRHSQYKDMDEVYSHLQEMMDQFRLGSEDPNRNDITLSRIPYADGKKQIIRIGSGNNVVSATLREV